MDKPPNFRIAKNCIECEHSYNTMTCDCCPDEYNCKLHNDHDCGFGNHVCDDFEKEK